MPATWFVTFEIRKRGLLHKKERSPRETRTFATEAEAKTFAQTKLEEGLVVFAGTTNPHSPKRVILSRDIAGWLVEASEPLSRSSGGLAEQQHPAKDNDKANRPRHG